MEVATIPPRTCSRQTFCLGESARAFFLAPEVLPRPYIAYTHTLESVLVLLARLSRAREREKATPVFVRRWKEGRAGGRKCLGCLVWAVVSAFCWLFFPCNYKSKPDHIHVSILGILHTGVSVYFLLLRREM